MAVEYDRIAHCQIFESLATTTLQRIAALAASSHVKPGTILFKQGNDPTAFYVVETGHVILYRQSKENKYQILAFVSVGETFGSESLPNNTPSPYTAKAVSPTTCLILHPSDVQKLLMHHPDFLALFLRLVSRRLRNLTSLVHQLAFHSVPSRLAAVLLTLAEADSEVVEDGLKVERLLSQKDLAAMVGTAREVVYRTIKQFEQDGLLRQTRQDYILLQTEALLDLASQEAK